MIAQAIAISRSILDAVDEQDWEQVQQLQRQRQPLIDEYFNGTYKIDAGQTQELKQLNDVIAQRLVDARQQTRKLQMNLQQGGKASRAYLANTSD